jgi:uncharacterized protein
MKFILFRDKSREWRWRLKARNGRNIAVSGEGYKRRSGALAAIELIRAYSMAVKIEEK